MSLLRSLIPRDISFVFFIRCLYSSSPTSLIMCVILRCTPSMLLMYCCRYGLHACTQHITLNEVSPGSCIVEQDYSLTCPPDHADYLVGLANYLGNVMTWGQSLCNEHSQMSFLDGLFNVMLSCRPSSGCLLCPTMPFTRLVPFSIGEYKALFHVTTTIWLSRLPLYTVAT